MLHRTIALTAAAALLAGLPLAADWPAAEKLDLDAIYKIKEEGLQRSHVMEIASYLTDVYGPRLTGSPDTKEAADWTQKTMKDWGLSNVHTEPWPFGRGWKNQHITAMALTPRAFPLIAYPKAWTPGTNGPITGEAVMAVINEEKDFAAFRGQLRGKFALSVPMREVPAHFDAAGRRFSDTELADLSKQPAPPGRGGRGNAQAILDFNKKKTQFWLDEGVAAVLDFSRGDDGTVFVQGGGSRDPKEPPVPPQVTLAIEHYGRIVRILEKKIPVTLQIDIANTFYDDRPELVQHRRRDPRDRQSGRGRDDRRALRLVAHRHGRHRQRGRIGGDARGDAHSQGHRRQAAAHRAHRPVDRRRSRDCSARRST